MASVKLEDSAKTSVKVEDSNTEHTNNASDTNGPEATTRTTKKSPSPKRKLPAKTKKSKKAVKKEEDPGEDQSDQDSNKENPKKKIKRGRKPGGTTFTSEQDAFIMKLRQENVKNSEIHRQFEEKFKTCHNEKSIENRWFRIKDSVLLTKWDEGLLMQAIDEIESDISAAVIKRFKELSNGKSVTKGYVLKKLKAAKNKRD